MSSRYTIKPKADRDLDDYADYLGREANLEVALRFLAAGRETFALLAAHPNLGWPSRLNYPDAEGSSSIPDRRLRKNAYPLSAAT